LGTGLGVDIDVRSFFDSVPMTALKAVAHHTDERWVLLYIERWLKAPMQMRTGPDRSDKGHPRGPQFRRVANLFMHYAFDRWIDREFPGCPWSAMRTTLSPIATLRNRPEPAVCYRQPARALGLELHPDKTRIVFCKTRTDRGMRSMSASISSVTL